MYQLVCSPTYHRVPGVLRPLLRASWSRPLARVVRWAVRHRGVPDPAVSWHLVSGPIFDNALATLRLADRRAELVVESTQRGGRLTLADRIELAG